jgi:hypothetical protein
MCRCPPSPMAPATLALIGIAAEVTLLLKAIVRVLVTEFSHSLRSWIIPFSLTAR